MELILSALKEAGPVSGPLAAILLGIYVWEKKDHGETRKSLADAMKTRVAEAMKMTEVITASNIAADARTEATQQNTSAFQQLTQVVNLLLFQRIGPPADGKPPQ